MDGTINKCNKFWKVGNELKYSVSSLQQPHLHPIYCFGILWVRHTHEEKEGRKKGRSY